MYLDRNFHARGQIFSLFDRVSQEFDLTDTQFETAKKRYESVGEWLAGADDHRLAGVQIYPQGSIGLGTAVKPLARQEYDVDLICFAPGFSHFESPSVLKRLVGDRLRAHGKYAPIIVEKPRCWRLDYAGEFHLDITPSIKNPRCPNGGELVPEKKSDRWKTSNPKGYRIKFERRAAMRPSLRLEEAVAKDSMRASVEKFPSQTGRKGILRLTVQLCKRHRDIFYAASDGALAPISIIITTLASRSYEWCVVNRKYDDAFGVLLDTVKEMPSFIDQVGGYGRSWIVENRTTGGENFAEKWNSDSRLAIAFFDWHSRIVADIEAFVATKGSDQTALLLGRAFGETPAKRAMDSLTAETSKARATGSLIAVPAVGLATGSRAASATIVRNNTFFGV
jgi:hypothetical protein